MKDALKNFWMSESGVTAIEYGLIAALIGLVLVATLILTGERIDLIFLTIVDCVSATRGPLC
jgi:pilus assembly protein Flp/PilA